MKNLLLLRHAKAERKDLPKPDFERVLADKGVRQSRAMGKVIKNENLLPDRVLCSAAYRTQETLKGINHSLQIPSENIIFTSDIYDFDAGGLLGLIHGVDDRWETLLLVGHNMAISSLLSNCLGEERVMRTADLAVLNFDVDEWAAVSKGLGILGSYYASSSYIS